MKHLALFAIVLTCAPLALRPSDGGDAVQEALSQLQAGDPAAAIATLEPLRQDPEAPLPALALLGALYVETGRPDEALVVLEPLADREEADPGVLYNAGRAALALGQMSKGDDYLQRSVSLSPVSPASRELGFLRTRQGRAEEALTLLVPWALANPSDLETRITAALVALGLGRLDEAEALLAEAPLDNPRVRLLKGKIQIDRGDPAAALEILEALEEERPEELDLDARRFLSEAYLGVGEASKAIALLEGHLGDDYHLAVLLGQARYRDGDPAGAVATLQPFVDPLLERTETRAPPTLAAVMLKEYGRALITLGRQEEAIPVLHRATETQPRHQEAWQLLGQALAATGRLEEAQEALARFREQAEEQEAEKKRQVVAETKLQETKPARMAEAFRLLESGDMEGGLKALEGIAVTPDDLRPGLLRTMALTRLNRLDEALAGAREVVELAPDKADALYARAVVYGAKQDYEAAERDFRAAIELAPNHTAAMDDLAVLLYQQGKKEEARQLLRQVLEINPDDLKAKENLELLGADLDQQ
jgi:Flp pilus assembly protein TadD